MTTGRGRARVAPRQLPVIRPGRGPRPNGRGLHRLPGATPTGTRVWRAVRVRWTAERSARSIGGRRGPTPSRRRSNPRRPPPVDRQLPVAAHRVEGRTRGRYRVPASPPPRSPIATDYSRFSSCRSARGADDRPALWIGAAMPHVPVGPGGPAPSNRARSTSFLRLTSGPEPSPAGRIAGCGIT